MCKRSILRIICLTALRCAQASTEAIPRERKAEEGNLGDPGVALQPAMHLLYRCQARQSYLSQRGEVFESNFGNLRRAKACEAQHWIHNDSWSCRHFCII